MKFNYYEINRFAYGKGRQVLELKTLGRCEKFADASMLFDEYLYAEKLTKYDWLIPVKLINVELSKMELVIEFDDSSDCWEVKEVEELKVLRKGVVKID